MEIAIVGSGIGGLCCAIALRKQGHHVKIYEQSRLNQETGAAIFLPPNINGLLRDIGFVPEQYGANLCLGWRHFSPLGDLQLDDKFSGTEYHAPWQMIHRQQLHRGLQTLAEDANAEGPAVKILTSARVTSVDAVNAVVHLEDGTQAQSDVVVGADGIHSATRCAIAEGGNVPRPFSAGANCYRFLIPRKELLEDPKTHAIFRTRDTLSVWTAEETKLVCYPCDDNVSMNFVAIHPSSLSHIEPGSGWHERGSKEALLGIYGEYCTEVKTILAHANPDKIRLYPLMDMESLDRWTRGRLALLGDAAHPFLPHLGQGGAMAIEDALSIGIFLPASAKGFEVPARLKLYEAARKERAHQIQDATRIVGLKLSELAQTGFDLHAERETQFRFNEVEHSRAYLSNHLADLRVAT